MRRFSLLTLAVLGLFSATTTLRGDDTVRLTKGSETVKVTIGDEVFTVFNHQPKWKKPFFIPVAAAGGLKVLADELGTPSTEPGVPGNTVLVVSEKAEIHDGGKAVGEATYGEVLEVAEVKGTELSIPAKKGWIRSTDVVPHKGIVTRLIVENPPTIKDSKSPLYYDHPHHKGIWFAIDEVNEIKFWAEQGVIKNVAVEVAKPEGTKDAPAVLKYTNHWLGTDEKPILAEETTVAIHPNRLMVFEFVLKAVADEVTFGDTKEGLFAVRVPNSMRESIAGGPVVNADGLKGTKECWGKTSAWVDYVGPIGSQKYGITLMDGFKGPRKSRYHVRDYGLFSMSPFGDKSYTNGASPENKLLLAKGETFTLKYGLYVHHGDATEGKVAEAYEQFAK